MIVYFKFTGNDFQCINVEGREKYRRGGRKWNEVVGEEGRQRGEG